MTAPATHMAAQRSAFIADPPRHLLRSVASRYLVRHRVRFFFALLAATMSTALIAAGPPILSVGIDGMRDGDRDAVVIAAVAYFVVIVLGGVAGGIRSAQTAAIGQAMMHELRCDAIGGLLRLDLGRFEQIARGDLQARVTADVEALTDGTTHLLPRVAGLVIAIVGGMIAIAILSPLAAVMSLLVLPPAAITGWWFTHKSRAIYPEYRRRVAMMTGHAIESVEATSTIQSYRAIDQHHRRLQASNRSVVEGYLAGTSMRNQFYVTLTITQSAVTAAIAVVMCLQALDGEMTVGAASAIVLSLATMLAPMTTIAGDFDTLLSTQAALVRVVDLTRIPATPAGDTQIPAHGALAFEDVTFSYVEGTPVLHSVSLTVAPGERLALVGATGSGKSTISRLATGLAEADTGAVTLAGVDVRLLTAEERRRRLILLPQETFLIEGTIAENVLLAHEDVHAARGRVDEAIRKLGVEAWGQSLPEGLDTPVGSDGSRLSAGERQLVALLRVMIAAPWVVALDEATSILDPAMQERVAVAMDAAFAGRIVIVVAHRLATAVRCDRIGVIEGGRLVAVGTHTGLLAESATYRRLWSEDELRMFAVDAGKA